MSKKKKGSKKERDARKNLLEQPWWKFNGNWFFVGVFVVIVLILVLAAIS
jgi:hypothetical protein